MKNFLASGRICLPPIFAMNFDKNEDGRISLKEYRDHWKKQIEIAKKIESVHA